MLGDTLLSQYASTPKVWNSYLKEYRRYAPDRNWDGRPDGWTDGGKDSAITICPQKSFGGIKTVMLKKVELMIAAKIVSAYDQEIPQSQTADNPVAPRGRAAQPSQDTRKTKLSNQLSLPHQDDCNTRMDIK